MVLSNVLIKFSLLLIGIICLINGEKGKIQPEPLTFDLARDGGLIHPSFYYEIKVPHDLSEEDIPYQYMDQLMSIPRNKKWASQLRYGKRSNWASQLRYGRK
uniref:Uncharacterized protein n=1 Tax=Parastrongyloides trichosuri TaxID=131310 RepID=A0A0N4ZLW7_PARTI